MFVFYINCIPAGPRAVGNFKQNRNFVVNPVGISFESGQKQPKIIQTTVLVAISDAHDWNKKKERKINSNNEAENACTINYL